MCTREMGAKPYNLYFILIFQCLWPVIMGIKVCCQTPSYDYGCTADFDARDFPLPLCPDDVPPVFELYTRDNLNTPQFITKENVPSFYSLSRTKDIFVVHGYTGKYRFAYMWIKDALLRRGDFNVIFVDWRQAAAGPRYGLASANTFTIGLALKAVAKKLIASGSTIDRLWCIGASLGAHLCGSAGLVLKFGRITGLDPAGILFDGYDRGLRKEAASFVDVIHTDGDGLFGILKIGLLKPLGHADFYPGGFWGGGKRQPACPPIPILNHVCSHSIVAFYFIQSIDKDCFISRNKCTNPSAVNGFCAATSPTVMGYGANPSASGLYFVPVCALQWPFCRG